MHTHTLSLPWHANHRWLVVRHRQPANQLQNHKPVIYLPFNYFYCTPAGFFYICKPGPNPIFKDLRFIWAEDYAYRMSSIHSIHVTRAPRKFYKSFIPLLFVAIWQSRGKQYLWWLIIICRFKISQNVSDDPLKCKFGLLFQIILILNHG